MAGSPLQGSRPCDCTTSDETAAAMLVAELLVDGPVEVGFSARGLQTLKLSKHRWPVSRSIRSADGRRSGRHQRRRTRRNRRGGGCPGRLLPGDPAAARPQPAPAAGSRLAGRAWSAEAEIKKAAGRPCASAPQTAGDRRAIPASSRPTAKSAAPCSASPRAGGQAIYRSVDLRDAAAVAAVITDVRAAHGPIKGLIHGAGVLADR